MLNRGDATATHHVIIPLHSKIGHELRIGLRPSLDPSSVLWRRHPVCLQRLPRRYFTLQHTSSRRLQICSLSVPLSPPPPLAPLPPPSKTISCDHSPLLLSLCSPYLPSPTWFPCPPALTSDQSPPQRSPWKVTCRSPASTVKSSFEKSVQSPRLSCAVPSLCTVTLWMFEARSPQWVTAMAISWHIMFFIMPCQHIAWQG